MDKKRVLVCDNDPSILYVLKLVLYDHGWEVITSANANTLLKEANEVEPAVILMDSGIDAMRGVSALRELKRHFLLKSIPIVFMSTNNNVVDLVRKSGAEFFLPKPFNLVDLERIMDIAYHKYLLLEDELQLVL